MVMLNILGYAQFDIMLKISGMDRPIEEVVSACVCVSVGG